MSFNEAFTISLYCKDMVETYYIKGEAAVHRSFTK